MCTPVKLGHSWSRYLERKILVEVSGPQELEEEAVEEAAAVDGSQLPAARRPPPQASDQRPKNLRVVRQLVERRPAHVAVRSGYTATPPPAAGAAGGEKESESELLSNQEELEIYLQNKSTGHARLSGPACSVFMYFLPSRFFPLRTYQRRLALSGGHVL